MVTGPSSGLGRETALALGRSGYHVIAAGRSAVRTSPVIDEIRKDGGSAEFVALDLASLASVRQAADQVLVSGRPIDVLVNNAGVGRGRGTTVDGFELHFGVNHLGHFALTTWLGEALGSGARVVQVTSAMHWRTKQIDFERLTRRTRTLLGLDEYALSKTCNILFAAELARRRPQLRTYSVHPGFVDTALIPSLAKPFLRRSLIPASEGAKTQIWCATSPDLEDETGGYYVRQERAKPSPLAGDPDLAAELWNLSTSYVLRST